MRLYLLKTGLTLNLIFLSTFVCADLSDLKLEGNFIQGGIVYGQVKPESKIRINGHWVRVSEEGEFIIGFGRDYPKESILKVYRDDGSLYMQTLKIATRDYKIQYINGLPDDKVNPDESALEKIKQERENISKARKLDDDRMDFIHGFIWPVTGPITGVFGSQRVLNGLPRQPHYGVDIAASTGTRVLAPAAGVVTYVNPDMYFSGGTLVLDHGHRLSSSFLHLHKILVKVGDRVGQGQEIAEVGATGRVTGAHLDWRMNWHKQRIDPYLLMSDIPK